ncbi:MAG: hypothetical protein HYX59_09115 [Elusimicrobia bacterium]|nr:hypothetical protein [Elusimicrobiota bacterium]
MRNLAVAVLLSFLCAASASADNAFMGHYGYMITYSNAYSARPEFHGAIEAVDLFPLTCKGLKKRMDCAKIGMVELAVMPKALVLETMGAKTFDEYLAGILGDAKAAGIKAKTSRKKRAGFPSALIEMPGHPQPLNMLVLIEGTKVYYRFKYNAKAGEKAAAAMVTSLKEIAPHDNPPEAGR